MLEEKILSLHCLHMLITKTWSDEKLTDNDDIFYLVQ